MSFRRAYEILLRFYPREHRRRFSAEMTAVFIEAEIHHTPDGWTALAGFVLKEMTGVLAGACREQIAKVAHSVCHTSSYISDRDLPNRLLMRPAGVAWEAHYESPRGCNLAREATQNVGPCLNAYQRFAFGSTLRRLIILACGGCRCGQAHL